MTFLEPLSALGGAMGELEGLSMIAGDHTTRLWSVSRIAPGEDQLEASVLGGGDEFMGIARGDFAGVFKPPTGKALFGHVLWAWRALARQAVGGCSLIVGRAPRGGARAWVMAGFCSEAPDFLAARAWQDGKTSGAAKADGKPHGHRPWRRTEAQPPAPYLESFSPYGIGAFSGTLADFTFSEEPSWEYAAISFLAAAVFPYVGSRGRHVGLCEYARLGGPAGIVLAACGMERASRRQTREKHGLEVVDFLPAGRTSPPWSFALCQRRSSGLWGARQRLVEWRRGR